MRKHYGLIARVTLLESCQEGYSMLEMQLGCSALHAKPVQVHFDRHGDTKPPPRIPLTVPLHPTIYVALKTAEQALLLLYIVLEITG